MLLVSGIFFFAMRAFGLLSLDEAAAAFRERTGWVLAGAAAQLLTLGLGVVRLGVLLSLFGLSVPMGRIAAATIISQAIGQYLPGSMAATELIRVGLLLGLGDRGVDAVDADLSARLMLASVLDRVLGLGAMLVFGGLTAFASLVLPGQAVHVPAVVLGFAAVSLVGGAFLLSMPLAGRFGRGLTGAGAWGDGGTTLVARLLRRLHGLFRAWVLHADYAARAPGKLVLAIILGAASLPVSCLTVWLPAFGGAAPVPFWPLVAVVPLLSLATVLPLGLAGFGSQQAFAALALAAFGVASGAVVTASLIQNVVALLVQTVVGALAAVTHGRELRALFRGAARRREQRPVAPADGESIPRRG
jgi:uncharacterized membrane protein YbhN (UPF0104 family)